MKASMGVWGVYVRRGRRGAITHAFFGPHCYGWARQPPDPLQLLLRSEQPPSPHLLHSPAWRLHLRWPG